MISQGSLPLRERLKRRLRKPRPHEAALNMGNSSSQPSEPTQRELAVERDARNGHPITSSTQPELAQKRSINTRIVASDFFDDDGIRHRRDEALNAHGTGGEEVGKAAPNTKETSGGGVGDKALHIDGTTGKEWGDGFLNANGTSGEAAGADTFHCPLDDIDSSDENLKATLNSWTALNVTPKASAPRNRVSSVKKSLAEFLAEPNRPDQTQKVVNDNFAHQEAANSPLLQRKSPTRDRPRQFESITKNSVDMLALGGTPPSNAGNAIDAAVLAETPTQLPKRKERPRSVMESRPTKKARQSKTPKRRSPTDSGYSTSSRNSRSLQSGVLTSIKIDSSARLPTPTPRNMIAGSWGVWSADKPVAHEESTPQPQKSILGMTTNEPSEAGNGEVSASQVPTINGHRQTSRSESQKDEPVTDEPKTDKAKGKAIEHVPRTPLQDVHLNASSAAFSAEAKEQTSGQGKDPWTESKWEARRREEEQRAAANRTFVEELYAQTQQRSRASKDAARKKNEQIAVEEARFKRQAQADAKAQKDARKSQPLIVVPQMSVEEARSWPAVDSQPETGFELARNASTGLQNGNASEEANAPSAVSKVSHNWSGLVQPSGGYFSRSAGDINATGPPGTVFSPERPDTTDVDESSARDSAQQSGQAKRSSGPPDGFQRPTSPHAPVTKPWFFSRGKAPVANMSTTPQNDSESSDTDEEPDRVESFEPQYDVRNTVASRENPDHGLFNGPLADQMSEEIVSKDERAGSDGKGAASSGTGVSSEDEDVDMGDGNAPVGENTSIDDETFGNSKEAVSENEDVDIKEESSEPESNGHGSNEGTEPTDGIDAAMADARFGIDDSARASEGSGVMIEDESMLNRSGVEAFEGNSKASHEGKGRKRPASDMDSSSSNGAASDGGAADFSGTRRTTALSSSTSKSSEREDSDDAAESNEIADRMHSGATPRKATATPKGRAARHVEHEESQDKSEPVEISISNAIPRKRRPPKTARTTYGGTSRRVRTENREDKEGSNEDSGRAENADDQRKNPEAENDALTQNEREYLNSGDVNRASGSSDDENVLASLRWAPRSAPTTARSKKSTPKLSRQKPALTVKGSKVLSSEYVSRDDDRSSANEDTTTPSRPAPRSTQAAAKSLKPKVYSSRRKSAPAISRIRDSSPANTDRPHESSGDEVVVNLFRPALKLAQTTANRKRNTANKSRRKSAPGRSLRMSADTPSAQQRRFTPEDREAIDAFRVQYCLEHDASEHDFAQKIQQSANNNPLMGRFWDEIIAAVGWPHGRRAALQKSVRRIYHTYRRGPWTAEEDRTLTRLYERKGAKWSDIAKHMDRMPEDVRDRYRNYAKGGDAYHKFAWSEKEADDLELAVGDCAALEIETAKERARADGRRYEGWSTDLSTYSMWGAVSARMGGTRSRLQCREKVAHLKQHKMLNVKLVIEEGIQRLLVRRNEVRNNAADSDGSRESESEVRKDEHGSDSD